MEVKLFAETGKQEILGNGNAVDATLDEFFIPAIKNGSGIATADFFVDSQHSMVHKIYVHIRCNEHAYIHICSRIYKKIHSNFNLGICSLHV